MTTNNYILLLLFIFVFITLIFVVIYINFIKKKKNKTIEKYNEKINQKFFNESIFSAHLDVRYGKQNINAEEIHLTLRYLLKVFSEYCKRQNIKMVIMHGSLIGYYFNKKILPWDDDIDLIIIGEDTYKLQNYNGNDYIIEVNPNSKNRSKNDVNNVIDARIISKLNGIFIDITYFFGKDILCAKDSHCYKSEFILPLKPAIFENTDVYVPNDIKNCLIQEYGSNVLKNTFKEWVFNENIMEWNKL